MEETILARTELAEDEASRRTDEPRLVVVASDRRELKAVAGCKDGESRPLAGLEWCKVGCLGDRPVVFATRGPGRENARRAVRVCCEQFPVGAATSTGLAGALNPEFRAGDLIILNKVIEFASRVEYAVELPHCSAERSVAVGKLLTVDEVAQGASTKARLRGTGADLVDMEASAVAAEAIQRRLPFYCVRAISDAAETKLPVDFNRARREDGTFSGWRIARQTGLSPTRWGQLWALWRDAKKAFESLGSFTRGCRFEF